MENKVTLIGRCGQNPEVKNFDNGNKIAKFSLATTEKYKNKEGEKVESTAWHNIIITGNLANVVEKYVKKGDLLYLVGKICYREYEKDGIKRYFTEIMVYNMIMLGTKGTSDEAVVVSNDKQDLPF